MLIIRDVARFADSNLLDHALVYDARKIKRNTKWVILFIILFIYNFSL